MTICLPHVASRSFRVVRGAVFSATPACLFCGVLFLLAGCGPANELGRLPVSGTVRLDGQPLDAGSISFEPTEKAGTSAGSAIEAGAFEIATERGLPPGTYVVRIYAPAGEAAPTEMPGDSTVQKERIPPAWNTDSKETVEVKPDTENVFTFDVKTGG